MQVRGRGNRVQAVYLRKWGGRGRAGGGQNEGTVVSAFLAGQKWCRWEAERPWL